MNETALAACAERLERVSATLRVLVSATVLALGLGVASLIWAPGMTAALMISAAVCAVAAAWTNDVRVEYLERLAIDRDAYQIPAVRRFGERLVAPAERRRLAAGLLCAVERASGHFGLAAPARLDACAGELCDVARQLHDRRTDIAPTSAAACRRLLGRAAESPLYNEDLPPEDLTAALYRIKAGITSS
ncbi:MAG: hypothetical protein ABSB69_20960 [Solirubrobacteraceae bacterium]